jgi:hypothetical protein
MDYSQTCALSQENLLITQILIIVRHELAAVLKSLEPKDSLLAVAEAAILQ